MLCEENRLNYLNHTDVSDAVNYKFIQTGELS